MNLNLLFKEILEITFQDQPVSTSSRLTNSNPNSRCRQPPTGRNNNSTSFQPDLSISSQSHLSHHHDNSVPFFIADEKLNDDIIELIAMHCTQIATLYSLSQVNRQWHSIITSKSFIQHWYRRHYTCDQRHEYLYDAVELNQLSRVAFLVRYGIAPVDAGNEFAIRRAASLGRIKMVRLLLRLGANVATESHGAMALALASERGFVDVVKELIVAGADVHVKNDAPLRFACMKGRLHVVKVLLDHGADVTAESAAAVRFSKASKHDEVTNLLLSYPSSHFSAL